MAKKRKKQIKMIDMTERLNVEIVIATDKEVEQIDKEFERLNEQINQLVEHYHERIHNDTISYFQYKEFSNETSYQYYIEEYNYELEKVNYDANLKKRLECYKKYLFSEGQGD